GGHRAGSHEGAQLPRRPPRGRGAVPAAVPGACVPNVCVIGSANVDYAVALPRLPSPGETVSGGTLLVNLGGKGANQAMAARRLGGEVRMIGGVGADTDGRRIRAALSEAARLSGLSVDSLESARAAAAALLERGAGAVLVTLGGQGVLTCDAASAAHYPAFPITAVDTTAAGDAFNGALAVGLAAGGTLE